MADHTDIALLALLALPLVVIPLLALLYVIYRHPPWSIQLIQNRHRDVLWHRPTKEKNIALTIDDAPSDHTAAILSTLAKYNAKATFFCIGSQMDGRQDILKEMVTAGHELGNHAMRDEPSAKLPLPELLTQIESVEAKIHSVYDDLNLSDKYPPRYFRPGSGFYNKAMREEISGTLGYQLVLGSIFPHDPQIPFVALNSWHIVSKAYGGGIIIVHDRRSWTQPTLERVLPKLTTLGYEVVTVTELLRRTSEIYSLSSVSEEFHDSPI